VFAAASPWLNDIGGPYLKDNDISPVDDEQKPVTADNIPPTSPRTPSTPDRPDVSGTWANTCSERTPPTKENKL
jgi:hypothetical protein